MNRIGLKYRIALTIFFLEAIMVALILRQTQKVSLESGQKIIAGEAQIMLNLVGNQSHFALINTEYSELQPYFEKIIDDPHVVQVLLTDYKNQVVVSTEPNLVGKVLQPLRNTISNFECSSFPS